MEQRHHHGGRLPVAELHELAQGAGSKNSFGLIFMSGVGAVTEEGDDGATYTDGSKYIALCKQCHGQASGYVGGAP